VVAGDGSPGIRDGANASFLLPAGLAVAADGSIYVADAAAQRIRLILRSGAVVTLAGSEPLEPDGLSVAAGYRDGPASQARFNHPTGIAISPDGTTVAIADTLNHCIRTLRAARVATLAGSPARLGGADGPASAAAFAYPKELAYAPDGTLYVADFGNGVRAISPDGTVRTLQLTPSESERRVTGVSVSLDEKNGARVTVADVRGIDELDASLTQGARYFNRAQLFGGLEPGSPFAIASFAPDEVVYTDLRTDSVRYLHGNFEQFLGGAPSEAAPLPGARAAAGPFRGPMAVAVAGQSSVVVADAGSRRILRIDGIERGSGFAEGTQPSDSFFAPNDYRIALIGNSYTWDGQTAADSVAAGIQKALVASAALRPAGKTPHVVYFERLSDPVGFAGDLGASGIYDCVVLLANSALLKDYSTDPSVKVGGEIPVPQRFPSQTLARFRAALARTVTALRANRVPLLIAVHPYPWEVSPAQQLYLAENFQLYQARVWPQMPLPLPPLSGRPGEWKAQDPDYSAAEREALSLFDGTQARVLDLWPAFRAADSQQLFGNEDPHFTALGRTVAAEAIARDLTAWEPWKQR
jgi:DNA-binding beta-propeller fold protein YncE